MVYFGANDGNVYALNATTGAKLWSYATGGAGVISSPAVANGMVYIGEDDADGHVDALNATTGVKVWSVAISSGLGVVSSPAVANGVVYVASTNANVYAFGLPGAGADLQLQVTASPSPVPTHSLYTYTFNITNNGPDPSAWPRLVAHVPYGATFHSYKFSPAGSGYCVTPAVGTRGDLTCRYQGTQAVGTTWTVTLSVWAWSPPGTIITETAGTWAATHDPNRSNNVVTITTDVQ
jgi:hypothetical protein